MHELVYPFRTGDDGASQSEPSRSRDETPATIARVTPRSDPPFDPDSPGVRALLRAMHHCELIDVFVTTPFLRISGDRGRLDGRTHAAGDRLTLPRAEGELLIRAGLVNFPRCR